MTTYHPVTEKVTSILKENNCWFETFEHEPVRTSEEAAKLRTGYTIHQGAKAIIARVKERGAVPPAQSSGVASKRFVMFILPGDAKLDLEKIEREFHFHDFRFAIEPEVAEITGGVLPGGIPPFGNLFGLEVFADKEVFNNEKIVFNAGDRSFSVGMLSSDYKKLVNPKVGNII